MGAKKFDMSLETQGIKLFGRDIPGFCRDIPGVPEKFEKEKFVFNFRSLEMLIFSSFLVTAKPALKSPKPALKQAKPPLKKDKISKR